MGRTHIVNVPNRTCTCGKWQEYDYPCVDAFAYFRLYEERSYEYIIDKHVGKFYRYETQHQLLAFSITPVVVDNLVKDGVTKPPATGEKRQAGRPKKTRIRSRSKFKSEDSPVICSLCHERGHNRLTCLARKEQKKNKDKQKNNSNFKYINLLTIKYLLGLN